MSGSMKPIIGIALVGGAFWYLMQRGGGATLSSIADNLRAGDPAAPPVPTLAQMLESAAGTNQLNADQWNYYLARLQGRTAVVGEAFDKAFLRWVDGVYTRPDEMPNMSAAEFATKLGLKGLAAYARLRRA